MKFGSGDFVKLFADFGDTDSFKLVPAVRKVGSPCVDEGSCDYEKATLCAFEGAAAKIQVTFLACMDEQEGVSALEATKACSSKSGLDYDIIASCYTSDHAQDLLAAASKTFNSYLPGRTTIPHTFVNDDDVSASYDALKSALCANGSSASVCARVTTDTSCVV
uniref:Uncharacterized protein n=1 Tax=Haptolina brevifila TaxID=156173 RepID=A0A7S2J939_9EUKA|mmetsp:Transcript_78663/g.156401  ORF Transcript_78663/g.156401 Transcript_78663/m.156401 type:complete len:164 (+) Transcript_78663:164-655(+)